MNNLLYGFFVIRYSHCFAGFYYINSEKNVSEYAFRRAIACGEEEKYV